jgi:S-phase kinase-associated protein 1
VFCKNTQTSSEGQSFEISFEAAKLLKALGIDDDDDMEIMRPVPRVKASVLSKVVNFCEHYKNEPSEYMSVVLIA